MSIVAEVRLWGRTVGAVSLASGEAVASFEYDPDFLQSGIQVAPLKMPLARRVYAFPELSRETFQGLPGLLVDALPDAFGHAVIDVWLAQQGRSRESFNVVERLCYMGKRGMGALEFLPAMGPQSKQANAIELNELVELASTVLQHRNALSVNFDELDRAKALRDIVRVGTSAGGARAKAVIAWNRETGEVRSGQAQVDDGFEHWLLKFDGVQGNRDKELADPKGFGLIEYAYYRMATDAGITMSECRLLKEHGRQHFMTRRFDRIENGAKLHMQSLGALAHFDYNRAGAYSYEQAFRVMQQLGLSKESMEEQFRRMVFNVVARNQDDHVKNIAFLMDKAGRWALSPAYDMTYSYQPSGAWTAKHQMSIQGKRDDFLMDDFRACARAISLQRGRAESIVNEVVQVVTCWKDYAEEVGVDGLWRDSIANTHRLAF